MLAWDTDLSLRDDEPGAAFAEVWCAIPKVVFSRTLDSVQGNARLAEASVAEEAARALAATDKDVDVGVGGAGLAAAAIELGLVDELRIFRNPIVVGGGTPFQPPVTEDVRLALVESRTFGARVIYESYSRARDESDRHRHSCDRLAPTGGPAIGAGSAACRGYHAHRFLGSGLHLPLSSRRGQRDAGTGAAGRGAAQEERR